MLKKNQNQDMKQPHYKQAIIQLNDFNITVAGVELGFRGIFDIHEITFTTSDMAW